MRREKNEKEIFFIGFGIEQETSSLVDNKIEKNKGKKQENKPMTASVNGYYCNCNF